MTKGKKLKRTIRARAEKTGERYAAARRRVVAKQSATAQGVAPRPAVSEPKRPPTKEEARVLERTGKPLEVWFAALDAFGAPEKGHTASARHLRELGMDGWYAQSVTGSYERARGLRVNNQTCDGDFEMSVSRVVPVTASAARAYLSSRAGAGAWLRAVEPALAAATKKSLSAWGAKPSPKAPARAKLPSGVKLELSVIARTEEKSTITIALRGLASADDVAAQRAMWASAIDALKASLAAPPGAGRAAARPKRPAARPRRAV